MYGTPQREVIFDLNDFDEAVPGPWEWDLKRLVAGVKVAGRQNGLNARERAAAVERGKRLPGSMSTACNRWVSWTCGISTLILTARTPWEEMDPHSKAVVEKTLAKSGED